LWNCNIKLRASFGPAIRSSHPSQSNWVRRKRRTQLVWRPAPRQKCLRSLKSPKAILAIRPHVPLTKRKRDFATLVICLHGVAAEAGDQPIQPCPCAYSTPSVRTLRSISNTHSRAHAGCDHLALRIQAHRASAADFPSLRASRLLQRFLSLDAPFERSN